jgi:putrescine transport system permease protein
MPHGRSDLRDMIRLGVWLWLLGFVAAPLLIVLGMGWGTAQPGIPPVRPPVGAAGWQGSTEAWALLFGDEYYLSAAIRSFRLATLTATACLVLGFAMALAIARSRRPALWLALVLAPFLAGFVLRMAAWVGLLRDSGWINTVLGTGWRMLGTEGAVLLGMVHSFLPFAVVPLVAALLKRDVALEEAAADLGASPAAAFRTVVLPLTLPGAAAGFLLVFIPAMGEVVIPELLGPPEARLVGRVLWEEFFRNRDWPLAAAVAVLLLLVLIPPIRLFQRLEAR